MNTKRASAVCALVSLTIAASLAPAQAAGNAPSEAQSITLGVAYFGDSTAAKGSTRRGSVWRLPPLLSQDVVTIAGTFQGVPHLTVGLAGNVDDFDYVQNWMNNSRSLDEQDSLPGGGAARLRYRVLNACGECFVELGSTAPAAFNYYNGAYSFTVESVQHALGLALTPAASISRKGKVRGTATLTNGSPVPDGLDVALIVRKGPRKWVRVAQSYGGRIEFKLKLPKSAKGKARLSLSRGTDAQYLAANTQSMKVRVK